MKTLTLDHLVYAVPDLQAAIDDLSDRLGVAAAYGGAHPKVGTHNGLLSLGSTSYLEIIAPDPTVHDPERARPFGLDGLTGPRLVTWAAAETDLEGRSAWSQARGYDPGQIVDAGRALPGGLALKWRSTKRPEALQGQLPPGDGLVPFLIDWGETAHPALSSPTGCRLISLVAEHPDPDAVSALLTALGVSLEVNKAIEPALIAQIAGPKGNVILR